MSGNQSPSAPKASNAPRVVIDLTGEEGVQATQVDPRAPISSRPPPAASAAISANVVQAPAVPQAQGAPKNVSQPRVVPQVQVAPKNVSQPPAVPQVQGASKKPAQPQAVSQAQVASPNIPQQEQVQLSQRTFKEVVQEPAGGVSDAVPVDSVTTRLSRIESHMGNLRTVTNDALKKLDQRTRTCLEQQQVSTHLLKQLPFNAQKIAEVNKHILDAVKMMKSIQEILRDLHGEVVQVVKDVEKDKESLDQRMKKLEEAVEHLTSVIEQRDDNMQGAVLLVQAAEKLKNDGRDEKLTGKRRSETSSESALAETGMSKKRAGPSGAGSSKA